MNKKTQYSLLYLEDDALIREMVIEYLEDYFLEIYVANNGQEALEVYAEKKPDIIITDIEMPKMNGLAFSKQIRQEDETTPIIITTAYTNTQYLLQAIELKLVKYLIKPIQEEQLEEALKLCFNQLKELNPSLIDLTQNYQYDLLNQTLIVNNNEIIGLSISQTKFLNLLIKHKHRTVTYQELENHIWYDKGMSGSALRSLVHDLRKLIHKDVIKNVSKTGYKIQLNE
ncbi:MAG: Putative two-component response regulator [uncultured Sulfurovum sp.]|uniref:Two-component response regulator n=1 Tax=uncultured Sulfurovum sp. TaxID=269237 RepID=A0A6S6SB40_9BACT|nr:MAG: Putative two-component response regulator [uncultured Sulfurovum sp.]